MARNPVFKKTVFENGLTLLTERHPEFHGLAIGVWIKVGTRHESTREAGMSHFLEHMLFKGTKKRNAVTIAREIDRVGGEFNAFTARDHTCFHLELLDRDIGLGLDILSDIVLNSTFDETEFEREKKVILQEISMIGENPEELAHDFYFEKIFPQNGLGRPILGTEEGIRKLKRKDLIQFFRHHYRPDQMVIAIAGNVSHDAVKKKLAPLTRAKWPGRPTAMPEPLGSPPPLMKSGAWWVKHPSEQVHLIWGVQGTPYASRDRFAAFLLNVHLGGGMSSSLFQEIRETRGLAYTVYSNLTPYVDTGVFSIYAATNMSQVPLCLGLIEKCVDRLRDKPLKKDELALIKDSLKGSILLSADDVESRMSSIARNEMIFGKYVPLEESCEQISAVTADDIQRLAHTLLGDGARSVFALGPKPPKNIGAIFSAGSR